MEKEWAITDKKGDVVARVLAPDFQAALKKAKTSCLDKGMTGEEFHAAEECHKPHVEEVKTAKAKGQKNLKDADWKKGHDNNLQSNVQWEKEKSVGDGQGHG